MNHTCIALLQPKTSCSGLKGPLQQGIALQPCKGCAQHAQSVLARTIYRDKKSIGSLHDTHEQWATMPVSEPPIGVLNPHGR